MDTLIKLIIPIAVTESYNLKLQEERLNAEKENEDAMMKRRTQSES